MKLNRHKKSSSGQGLFELIHRVDNRVIDREFKLNVNWKGL